MAQNIKFGDVDVQIPSFNFQKFGGLIPLLLILFLASLSFYTVDANEQAVLFALSAITALIIRKLSSTAERVIRKSIK